jgi:hypothetical protein
VLTSVIPAKAGIQLVPGAGNPGFRLALRLAGMTPEECPASLPFDNRHSQICNNFTLPPSPRRDNPLAAQHENHVHTQAKHK